MLPLRLLPSESESEPLRDEPELLDEPVSESEPELEPESESEPDDDPEEPDDPLLLSLSVPELEDEERLRLERRLAAFADVLAASCAAASASSSVSNLSSVSLCRSFGFDSCGRMSTIQSFNQTNLIPVCFVMVGEHIHETLCIRRSNGPSGGTFGIERSHCRFHACAAEGQSLMAHQHPQ